MLPSCIPNRTTHSNRSFEAGPTPSTCKQNPWLSRLCVSQCFFTDAVAITPVTVPNERFSDAGNVTRGVTRYDTEFVVSRKQERPSSDGWDFELKSEMVLPARWSSEKEGGTRLFFLCKDLTTRELRVRAHSANRNIYYWLYDLLRDGYLDQSLNIKMARRELCISTCYRTCRSHHRT